MIVNKLIDKNVYKAVQCASSSEKYKEINTG